MPHAHTDRDPNIVTRARDYDSADEIRDTDTNDGTDDISNTDASADDGADHTDTQASIYAYHANIESHKAADVADEPDAVRSGQNQDDTVTSSGRRYRHRDSGRHSRWRRVNARNAAPARTVATGARAEN